MDKKVLERGELRASSDGVSGGVRQLEVEYLLHMRPSKIARDTVRIARSRSSSSPVHRRIEKSDESITYRPSPTG